MHKKYSLDLSEIDRSLIKVNIPEPEPIPEVSDKDFSVDYICSENKKSLNLCSAFANYLVQRNQTSDLSIALSNGKKALDSRNKEQEKIKEIEIEKYTKKLNTFIENFRKELSLDTQKIYDSAKEISEQIKSSRKLSNKKNELIINIIRHHIQRMEDLKKKLEEIKQDLEKSSYNYIIKNKYYYELESHCIKQLNQLTKYLKAFSN